MLIEILNNFLGDNKVEIDTDSEEGKQKVAELFMKLLKSGTAIFLERATETYRVTGYDQATDSLKVMVPVPPRLPLALPPAPEEVVAAASGPRPRGRNRAVHAKPRSQRGDRVTAVAPRSGG